MKSTTVERICVYINLGYSAERIAELMSVPVIYVDTLKRWGRL